MIPNDECNSHAISEAEVAFVQNRYRTALHIAMMLLNSPCNSWEHHHLEENDQGRNDLGEILSQPDNDRYLITIGIAAANANTSDIEYDQEKTWTVRLSSSVSTVDRAAVIAMQCAVELSRNAGRRDGSLSRKGALHSDDVDVDATCPAICEAYGRFGKISMEAAVVWTQFCVRMNKVQTAAIMARNVLVSVSNSEFHDCKEDCSGRLSNNLEREKMNDAQEAFEEMMFTFFTRIIPQLQKSDASRLLEQITTKEIYFGLALSTKRFHILERPTAASIEFALDALQYMMQDISLSPGCVDSCKSTLHYMLDRTKRVDYQECVDTTFDATTAHSSVDNCEQNGVSDRKPQSTAPVVRDLVISRLWKSDNRWENRFLLVVLGLTILGIWKRRNRVAVASRTAMVSLLSPFKELVDAVVGKSTGT